VVVGACSLPGTMLHDVVHFLVARLMIYIGVIDIKVTHNQSKYCGYSNSLKTIASPSMQMGWTVAQSLSGRTLGARKNPRRGSGRQYRHTAPDQKSHSNNRHKCSAPSRSLLNRHNRRQCQHPGEMRNTHRRHDQHQRPAATETIESVADTKIPRRSEPTAGNAAPESRTGDDRLVGTVL